MINLQRFASFFLTMHLLSNAERQKLKLLPILKDVRSFKAVHIVNHHERGYNKNTDWSMLSVHVDSAWTGTCSIYKGMKHGQGNAA
jgi:hypothetical protein